MRTLILNYIYIGIALVVLFTLSNVNQNFAQTISGSYSWSGSGCPTPNASLPSATGLTFTQLSRGSSLSCNSLSGTYSSKGWSTSEDFSSSSNAYIEFAISSNSSTSFVITSMTLDMDRNSNGPDNAKMRYCSGTSCSFSSFGSDINVSSSRTVYTLTPSSPITLSPSKTITFRLYGWQASSSSSGFLDLYTVSVSGQTDGGFFRSARSGNWSTVTSGSSSWQISANGSTWSEALIAPSNTSGAITIQNGHTITVTAAVTADQLTINSGGRITINSGQTLTINNGSGTDFINNGILDVQGSIGGSSGPACSFESGSSLITNNSTGVNGALGSCSSLAFSSSKNNNFTFNSSSNQATGTLMPTIINNITISGSGTKTLSQKTTILPTGTVTLSGGTFNLNNDSLILQSNSSSTARVAAITSGSFSNASKFTIQRFIPSGGGRFWWHLSSPVANTFVSDWQHEFYITGNFPNKTTVPHTSSSTASLKYYDESVAGDLNLGWVDYPTNISSTTAPLVVGRGYTAFIRNSQYASKNKTINVTGTPNTGTINYNVQYHSSGNINNDGWNFVGNPYPSDIDWANSGWSRTNVSNAVYVWNAATSTYSSFVNGVGVNGGTGRIPSSHAFWVKAIGSSPSLTSSESVKTSTQNIFTKQEAISNLLKIKLKDSIASDEIAIRFDEEATNNFDNTFDAYGMTGPHLGLSTTSADSVALAINTMPEITDGLVIQLNTYFSANGTYKMILNNHESVDGEFQIYLRDKFLNQSLEANKDSILNFSVTSEPNSNAKNRFEIVFKKAQATAIFTPKNNLNFNLYPNPSDGNNLTFTFAESLGQEYQISIIDMVGKVMMSKTSVIESGPNSLILDFKLPSGIYVVNCTTNEKTATKTLVIK